MPAEPVRVVPCTRDHLAAFPAFLASLAAAGYGVEAVALADAEAVCAGERVLACYGVRSIYPGVADGWGLVAPGLSRAERFHLGRAAVRFMARMLTQYHRVEARVRVDFPEALKVPLLLGMTPEGRVACYDADGTDHILFGRTRR
ncbi:MAG: hypothetical protein ABFE08_04990 [Armatimonadia bacterium]